MKRFQNLKKKYSDKTNRSNTPEEKGPVTNETVLQHRDQVLKKGRQFKYPFHHSKHRIAFISVTLVLLGVVLLGLFTGYQLYRRQSTGAFTYGVTQILPFPVAEVDGERVSYESYLFELRSSLHWQEKYGTTDLQSPDGKRQIEYLKRQALDKALANTIAKNLAKKHNISVSGEEIDATLERTRQKVVQLGGSLQTILPTELNMNESELRRLLHERILREKVAKALDTDAPQRAENAREAIKDGKSFARVAKQFSDHAETKESGGDFGTIQKGYANVPEEVEDVIFKTRAGRVTEIIETPTAYYIAHVRSRSSTRARISLISITVKDIAQYLEEYRTQGKIREYIKIEDISPEQAG